MRGYAKFLKRAKELGAIEANIIPVKSIVVAEWVRLKCQFGCDGYGQSLTCPPYSPTPEETRRVLI
jgi:predicted metal-binding protein